MTTRARSHPLRLVLVALVVSLPVTAAPPADQYERFDEAEPTIKDRFTKLEWLRDPVTGNYAIAAQLCGTQLPGGRLPTVKELMTILDEEPHLEYEFGSEVSKMSPQLAFPDTPVDEPYWTSSPAGDNRFWTVSFATGAMEARLATTGSHGRCVR